MNLTVTEIEMNVLQCMNAGKALIDAVHFKQ